MRNLRLYKIQLLKWGCIGLAIRFILMPFTMHGFDLFYINYFPMMFIKEGIWDPYGFIALKFPYFNMYYGPFLFIIMAAVNFIFIKLFGIISLIAMLEHSTAMMFKQFTTVDYVNAFPRLELFENLFLMKSPYLIFDFLIAIILLKLSASKKLALESYRLWMLNIVVLHSAYMLGQFELITAFFIILALFFAVKRRPYLSIVSLSLGGATKLFPYILIFPAALLLGNSWKKRATLLFTAGFITGLLYLPFYISSGSAIFGYFTLGRYYSGVAKWLLITIFVVLYALISKSAVNDSKNPEPEKKLLFYFLTISFLIFAITPISFRYFVFITPLLALVLPGDKKFGIFMIFIILMLAFLRLPERHTQMGLFSPLNPEYFYNLPTIQGLIGQFVNIEIIYKIMSKILMLSFFIASWIVWQRKDLKSWVQ